MLAVKLNNFHIHGEVKFPFSTICGVSSESLPEQQANLQKKFVNLYGHLHTFCIT
jgi:hypothetical protein